MGPALVLFDVDGTLVDTAGAGRRALERAFIHLFGVQEIAVLARGVAFEGKTDPIIIAEMAREAALDPSSIEPRAEAFRTAYLEALRDEMARPDPRRRILPGVLALLQLLHPRADTHLALLTGNIEDGARTKLEPFGLNAFFPTGGFSSDHHDRREIARLAREKVARRAGTAFDPERVAVVGDTTHDIECARANGYRAVAVLTGWCSRERLEAARPDVLLEDLSDLDVTLRALGLE